MRRLRAEAKAEREGTGLRPEGTERAASPRPVHKEAPLIATNRTGLIDLYEQIGDSNLFKAKAIKSDVLTVHSDSAYVYGLVDPRDSRLFYVGKGRSDRALSHERSVIGGHWAGNADKHNRIVEILKQNCRVGIVILGEFDSDDEASKLERLWIDREQGLTNWR